jgi:hypothetical protein
VKHAVVTPAIAATVLSTLAVLASACGDERRAGSPADAAVPADADGSTRPADAAPAGEPAREEEQIAFGMAKVAEAVIYATPSKEGRKLGILRWGAPIDITDETGEGEGAWVRMKGVGWLQASDVQTRRKGPPKMGFVPIAPVLDQPLPFRYARVTAKEVPVYRRPPKRGEDPQRAYMRDLRDGYFFTVDKFVNIYDREMYRTTRYWFVPREGTTVVSGPTFEGVEVDEATKLPFLWVTDPTAVLCDTPTPAVADAGIPCPPATRHERLPYLDRRDTHGIWYKTKGNQWIPALTVAKVDRVERRPREVGPTERWIHVDLRNQFAGLYEGDRMVFATLISSGDDGHETPTGTFRLEAKHVSATMDNEENPSGPYMIQDVPWVMFFRGSYALHGAFWHDRFGLRTSHGCVNLAPADARRFFNFASAPELPEGWHAVYTPAGVRGTVVHITN